MTYNQSYRNDNYVTWVKPSGKILFQPKSNNSEMRLLVTSAFNQAQEKNHCTEASKEIGEALRNLPFHVKVDVHPYITCEAFPDLLKGKQYTAWLHISHGHRGGDLYESRTKELASPERWLTCFNAYGGSLPLVILSACHSARMARLLAESGVSVAIGFEKSVLTKAAINLTKEVLLAPFRVGVSQGATQDAILSVFREVVADLESKTYLDGTKQKRYSDAGPRAFALNLKSL